MLIVGKTGQKWNETRLKIITNNKEQTRQSMLPSESFNPKVLRCIGCCRQQQVVTQFKQVSQAIAFCFVGSELFLIAFEAAFQKCLFEFTNDVWNTCTVKSAYMKLKLGIIIYLMLIKKHVKKSKFISMTWTKMS